MEKEKFKIIEKGFSSDTLSNIEQYNINGGWNPCPTWTCGGQMCIHDCVMYSCDDFIFEPCKDLVIKP